MAAPKRIISQFLPLFGGVLILAAICWAVYVGLAEFVAALRSLDSVVAAGVIAASSTVFVSTLTVVIGRYLERRKEIESHFRNKKVEIYDEFLKKLFDVMNNSDEDVDTLSEDDGLVEFLREWQRKIIIWGGQDVVNAFNDWKENLQSGNPTAKTMFLMEDFFKAIRKDIGHKNWRLKQGAFISMIVKHPKLFLLSYKNNPDITLAEIAELENTLQSPDENNLRS